MTPLQTLLRGLGLLLFVSSLTAFADDAVDHEALNDYWRSVSTHLAEGNFEAVSATYHPEAVLVSEYLGTSYRIARALKRWKPGIDATRAGDEFSMVEFRITRRLSSEDTSHEQGMFHFRTGPTMSGANPDEFEEAYVHFEALLLKNDRWTLVMEYQKQPASLGEWRAAAAAGVPTLTARKWLD